MSKRPNRTTLQIHRSAREMLQRMADEMADTAGRSGLDAIRNPPTAGQLANAAIAMLVSVWDGHTITCELDELRAVLVDVGLVETEDEAEAFATKIFEAVNSRVAGR